MAKEVKPIRSIERAFTILNCFEKNVSLGVTDISKLSKLHKSTTYNIMQTLEHLGVLVHDENSSKYKLGLELFKLGTMVDSNIKTISKPFLEKLSVLYSETINLVVREDKYVLFLEIVESPHAIRGSVGQGTKLPIYCTAVGKSIMSTLGIDELNGLLDKIHISKITENTVADKAQLLKQIEYARTSGFAIDFEEYDNGFTGVAAPIINRFGKADYAISVAGPTNRLSKEKLESIGKVLVEYTNEISNMIGYY